MHIRATTPGTYREPFLPYFMLVDWSFRIRTKLTRFASGCITALPYSLFGAGRNVSQEQRCSGGDLDDMDNGGSEPAMDLVGLRLLLATLMCWRWRARGSSFTVHVSVRKKVVGSSQSRVRFNASVLSSCPPQNWTFALLVPALSVG